MLLALAALTTSGHSTAGDRDLAEASDFRVRVQAALRLGRVGGSSSRVDLEGGLRDAHPAVRVACAARYESVSCDWQSRVHGPSPFTTTLTK